MWTAVSLGVVFLGGLGLYIAWALEAARRGWSAVTLVLAGVLLYAAVFAVVTAGWFLLAWIYRVRRPADVRLSPAGTVRLFWNEWVTLMGSGLRMGFGWWFMREPRSAHAAAPVLLVHGVLCNAGVWLGMRRALRRLGLGPLYTISYGPPLSSIERFADALAARIEAILAATGATRVALVGHSMGGLVGRAYLRRYGTARVSCLVTIGTPHAGSAHAWLFPGTSLAQLRRGNDWLGELNGAPPTTVPIVSIWSWHDSMVAPQDSCVLPGARNIAVKGVGHNALLRDPEVARLVAAEVASAH